MTDISNDPINKAADSIKATHSKEDVAAVAGALLLRYAGEKPDREGLMRTPRRFSKAMSTLLSGYAQTPQQVVGEGVFPTESRGVVAVNKVEFYSLCEHHMLPFWGTASVAYYPDRQILGLSKIPRLIDLFARRLQVQERLTEEIAQAMMLLIKPRAVLVRANGHHLCMMMRGVEKQQSFTTTEVIKGAENLSPDELNRLYSVVQD